MHFLKWTWASDHMKTINLSAGNLKKYSTSMGRYLSLRYGQVIPGQRIPCFDSCQLITTFSWTLMCNQFSPGLPNIGCPVVRTEARAVGRRTVTWLPNFLGWIDLAMVWRSSSQVNLAPALTHWLADSRHAPLSLLGGESPWNAGIRFKPRTDQHSGSLNNWEESAAFVMTSANS